MKILHITEKPRFSGAEILIRDLALTHINKASIAIASVNPIEKDFEAEMELLKANGIQLFIPNNSLSKFLRLKYLFTVFKIYQPDIVIGHSAIISAYMRVVGVLFPNIKKIIVLHATADYEKKGRLKNAEYILQYFTNYVVGVSNIARDNYQKLYSSPPCKTIFNGIDINKFNRDLSSHENEIRNKEFNSNDGTFIILQVGRINQVKNQLLTLKAFSMLKEKNNIKIIFAGIIEDKKYYAELNKFINNHGINHNVIFLGARTDVNLLIEASNLFVMPSERESFGIALVEALAVGIPIIYSDIPGFSFLENYNLIKTYKVNTSNIERYSHTISKIIQEKPSFVNRNLNDFSLEKCSDKYLKLFRSIIE